MEIIEKIRKEIERLKEYAKSSKMEWEREGYNQNAFAEDCRISSFNKLLTFLDSLQEEMPKDLEKVAKVNARNYGNGVGGDTQQRLTSEYDFYQGFIAGAGWRCEQEETPTDLEEEIDKTVNECTDGYNFDWDKFALHFYELGKNSK